MKRQVTQDPIGNSRRALIAWVFLSVGPIHAMATEARTDSGQDAATPPTESADLEREAAKRRALGVHAYLRALSPVARVHSSEAAKRAPAMTTPSLLRFETTVEVSAPPLDFNALGASWWAHWNLAEHPGPPGTRSPSHNEMLEHMSGTLPRDVPKGVDLLPLAISGVPALVKKIFPEKMPPADSEPQ